MTLSEYLKKEKISKTDFAAKIGASRSILYAWLNGKKKPTRYYEKIAEATDGAVTANDFYGLGNGATPEDA